MKLLKSITFLLILSINFAHAGPNFWGGGKWEGEWVGSWATGLHNPSGFAAPPEPVTDQTLRQIVHLSVGGYKVRVTLSNLNGTAPMNIDAASVGIQDSEANIKSGSLRALTFGGETSVKIPAGAKVLSDPISLKVADQTNLAINLYVSETTPPTTVHSFAYQTSYIIAGDATQSENAEAQSTITSWYWIASVDVLSYKNRGAIVTLGDSITDGVVTTIDANNRWPNFLARRLLEKKRFSTRYGVLNTGIGGNRLIHDFTGVGRSAQARFDRDVLTQAGVSHLIFLIGVNDLGFPNIGIPGVTEQVVSAEDIIAGMKQLIIRAHANGIKVIGGTILPYKGAGYYTEEGEAKRQAVNEWIRTTSDLDGYVDFDKAIRDPNDPESMLAEYDSGDFLHPNDAGMEAMANAIDLRLFKKRYHRYY